MREFIYKLFRLEYIPCYNCQALKLLLEDEKRRSNRLLEQIFKEPEVKENTPVHEPIPFKPKLSLNAMRKRLEAQDIANKEHEQLVAEVKKEKMDELEKVLLGKVNEA